MDGERDPSQEALSSASVLVSLARYEFKQETNTCSGNETASLIMKYIECKAVSRHAAGVNALCKEERKLLVSLLVS